MTQSELNLLLYAHEQWLNSNYEEGITFSALSLDFTGLSFAHRRLIGANLVECKFTNCDMQHINLESINVTKSDFSGANLAQANLKRCDFRNVKFDAHTNFEGAKIDGMLVDKANYHRLPSYLEKYKLSIEDCLTIELRYENEADLQIMKGITTSFVELLEQIHTNLPITSENNGNKYILKISGLGESEQDEVLKAWNVVGEMIKGFVRNDMQTSNDSLQVFKLKQDIEILELKYKMNEKFIQDKNETIQQQNHLLTLFGEQLQEVRKEKTHLLEGNALLQNTVAQYQQTIENHFTDFRGTLNKVATQIINQIPARESLPTSTRVEIETNKGKQTIEAHKFVYADKDESGLLWAYFDDNTTLRIEHSISEFADKLQRVYKSILRCHKQFILNTDFVDSHQSRQNVIDVVVKGYPEAKIVVSANSKDMFRELLKK